MSENVNWEDWLILDLEMLIEKWKCEPHFCKYFARWRKLNHSFWYLACLLAIEGKIIDA